IWYVWCYTMAKQLRSSSYRIKNFDVSGREIGIFIAFIVFIGLVILTFTWKYMGGELFSSPISVVETADSGQTNLPNITDVSVSDITPTTATINWQINGNLPIRIDYGLQQNQLISQISVPPSTTFAKLSSLFPHVKYFFRLTVNPETQFSFTSPTYSFITPLR
ncbi:MAG: fibronectin type III domain-containing protein, partial [Patescibacteria group bacterium]